MQVVMNRLSEWAIVFRNQLPESLPVFVILQKHCFTFATGPPGLRKGAVFRRRVRALFRHKHVYKSRRWRHVRHWLHKAVRERMWWVFLLFVFFSTSQTQQQPRSLCCRSFWHFTSCACEDATPQIPLFLVMRATVGKATSAFLRCQPLCRCVS